MTVSARRALRIAVTSDHALVAETARSALSAHGLRAETVPWVESEPQEPESGASGSGPSGSGASAAGGGAYDAGLAITESTSLRTFTEVGTTLTARPLPWVVLTRAPRGPLWGAALAAGAVVVLASDRPLGDVVAALRAAARGVRDPRPPEAQRLREQWARLLARRERLLDQLASLTPREHEVLRMIFEGDSAAEIAAACEVSITTVRSQVKAVLRKLDVNSQLAAVGLLDRLLDPEEPTRQVC